MSYFDCYLIPVPAAKLNAYKRFSEQMARVYREYGAVRVIDCVLDPDRARAGLNPQNCRTVFVLV